MESQSQLQRSVGHTYDQDPQTAGLHSVVEDEGQDHHHEKKSVLNKVKAKAKKIKDTLTKHGHGHEHEHERDYTHNDHDEDEEDDEDEEIMVEDPEIHGAPMYESAAIRSAIPPQNVNLEKPTAIGEDRYDEGRRDKVATNRPDLQGQSGENLGRRPMEVVHEPDDKDISFPPAEIHGTKGLSGARKEEENVGRQRFNIGVLEGLKEDPHAPKIWPEAIPPSNYETKVTDPTGKGGDEVEINPLIRSFDKMGVSDESEHKLEAESGQRGYTGSHHQFAPQTNPTEGEFAPKTSTSKSYDPSKPEDLPRDNVTGKSSDQSGYAEKISVATSMIADKAISAKNIVASKLGYGGTEGVKAPETEGSKEAERSGQSATEYAHKVAATVTEKLAPVYEKVADAGGSVMSKVKGTGTGNEGAEITGGKVPDKGVSVKEYWAEKFKPGEEDKALSEVISGTLHKKKDQLGKSGESKPMGKVTESEEVSRHLGTENRREGEDARAAGSESSGKGVVDRLKGAVSSWISKGGEQQHSQGSPDSSFVSNQGGSSATSEVGHPQG